MAASRKYPKQRPPKVPPHVNLKNLRTVSGLTIEQLIERVAQTCDGYRPTKGAISALESGLRGGSVRLLRSIEKAYGLPDGAIVTDYLPRVRASSKTAA